MTFLLPLLLSCMIWPSRPLTLFSLISVREPILCYVIPCLFLLSIPFLCINSLFLSPSLSASGVLDETDRLTSVFLLFSCFFFFLCRHAGRQGISSSWGIIISLFHREHPFRMYVVTSRHSTFSLSKSLPEAKTAKRVKEREG